METAPNTAAKAETLKLTSRFPTSARDASSGEVQTNVVLEGPKGSFPAKNGPTRPVTQSVHIHLPSYPLRLSPAYYSVDFSV